MMNNWFYQMSLLLTVLFSVAAFSSYADTSQIYQGSVDNAFSSWGKRSAQGDWNIVEEGGQYFLDFADNFSAKEGPDVKVFLSPSAGNALTGNNAATDALSLGLLSQFEGSSRIAIPIGTDLDNYQMLVLHCKAYSKLWGTSSLR